MGRDNELLRLERHIEQLLQRFAVVRDKNRRLERDLSTAVADNEHLKRQLETMTAERQEMTTRVDSLIDRIESWQAELTDEAVSVDDAQADQSATNEEQTAARPETDTENKQERDGSIQGSLFSR